MLRAVLFSLCVVLFFATMLGNIVVMAVFGPSAMGLLGLGMQSLAVALYLAGWWYGEREE